MFSIVMVIKRFTYGERDNLDRFVRVGMVTYERFMDWSSVRDFWVIHTKDEGSGIEKELMEGFPHVPWRFVCEDELVPSECPVGWSRQQTAKLAIAERVQTPEYLIVDDDCILTKAFSYKDMFYNGKLIMNKIQIDFPFFFLWSAQVLDADYDVVQDAPFHMGITPEIFVTDVVRDLVDVLTCKYGASPAWQRYLAEHKYTEYCLYWIYLLSKGKCGEYYAMEDTAPSVYSHATTGSEHNLSANLQAAFLDTTAPFTFVQTSLPYATDEVLQDIKTWFQ